MRLDPHPLVERSIDAYERAHATYEDNHVEIFNDVEQHRLHASIDSALQACITGSDPLHALDLGCGSGNLTRHLVDLGARVTASDVSPRFLTLIADRFRDEPRVSTLQLNGVDLAEISDASYDVVGAYSVLHHIPDYLGAVHEAIRVLKPGGILYLDHEHNEDHWSRSPQLAAFDRAVAEVRRSSAKRWDPKTRRWQRALLPTTYVRRLQLLRNPDRHRDVEGDIHTHEDDHIEWDAVIRRAELAGARLVAREDYLLYRPEYPLSVYRAWSTRCTNMAALALRKSSL